VKKLATTVMLSAAKHPCIYKITQIQGFFVASGSSE
jgi:hypothetical protein